MNSDNIYESSSSFSSSSSISSSLLGDFLLNNLRIIILSGTEKTLRATRCLSNVFTLGDHEFNNRQLISIMDEYRIWSITNIWDDFSSDYDVDDSLEYKVKKKIRKLCRQLIGLDLIIQEEPITTGLGNPMSVYSYALDDETFRDFVKDQHNRMKEAKQSLIRNRSAGNIKKSVDKYIYSGSNNSSKIDNKIDKPDGREKSLEDIKANYSKRLEAQREAIKDRNLADELEKSRLPKTECPRGHAFCVVGACRS